MAIFSTGCATIYEKAPRTMNRTMYSEVEGRSVMPGCERADFDRYCSTHGETPGDRLHDEAWRGLMAYEETLHLKWGHTVHANYTWRSLRKQGLIRTMEDHVLNTRTSTQGFRELVNVGKWDLTDEYQIIQFREEVLKFRSHDPRTEEAIRVATRRLLEFGCPVPIG